MHTSLMMYGGYPDARDGASFGMGALGFVAYVPDLAPVGSGSQGTYYPRDTSGDAEALNYVGRNLDGTNNYYSDESLAKHVGTTGSQEGDKDAEAGAWESYFRDGIMMFQRDNGLPDDGWIGPQTRMMLATRVAERNASDAPMPSPNPIPPPPPPPIVHDPRPTPGPGPTPVSQQQGMSTMTKVGIGVGIAAALGVGYLLMND